MGSTTDAPSAAHQALNKPGPKPLRCAIYAPVSTEHGLEHDFNSLQAQRQEALPVEVQDHHEFPKSDHRAAPSRQGEQHR